MTVQPTEEKVTALVIANSTFTNAEKLLPCSKEDSASPTFRLNTHCQRSENSKKNSEDKLSPNWLPMFQTGCIWLATTLRNEICVSNLSTEVKRAASLPGKKEKTVTARLAKN